MLIWKANLSKFIATLLFIWGSSFVFAQNQNNFFSSDYQLTPTLSAGVGTMAYYGDISNSQQGLRPNLTRLGYQISLSAPLTNEFSIRISGMFGKLGANESSINRNLNFQSEIRTGGVNFEYNFGHLLPEYREIEPYFSVGIESIEFLSKTDLFDSYGNQYNYWSDGSIRNLPEDHPNANDAVQIQRNYRYESDIRELDIDGFGRYREQSFAVPVGIGFQMHIHENLKFRFGTAMYFTFTNLIDGITEESVGVRQGNARNDRFLYTSFGLSYNFKPIKNEPEIIDIRLLAFEDQDDEDEDGVIDVLDRCPGTPPGVEVDEWGCPVDSDGDGVPDYLDEEEFTPEGTPVDARGRTLTDEQIEQSYLVFSDSITDYVRIEESIVADFGKTKKGSRKKGRIYMVQVGNSSQDISANMIATILSIPDVQTYESGDTTYYMVGNYDNLPDAVKRMFNLDKEGIPGEVVTQGEKGFKTVEHGTDEFMTQDQAKSGATVFRVQVGAFSKKLSKEVFPETENTIVVRGEDGLYRYYSGSFTDMNAAARHKVEITMKGYEGAFIVAYRAGERISLKEAGATMTTDRTPVTTSPGKVSRDKVKFRVQVGAFSKDVPMSILDKFLSLGDVKPYSVFGQPTKYLYGSFNTYEEAQEAQKRAVSQGITDAFVVGDFDGRVISASEARDLIAD
jgi:hypothetical protein